MKILNFKDNEGNDIYVEVEDNSISNTPTSDSYGDSFEPVGGIKDTVNDVIELAKNNFENTCSSIAPTIRAVYSQISSIPEKPDEISLELGFKLSADAGFVLAKFDSEVTVKVTAKWKGTNQ